MRGKIKKRQLKKIAGKIAKYGFVDVLHDKNLSHLLSFFKFRKYRKKQGALGKNADLIRLLCELGPGFVEAARISASRSDLIPKQYQNDLLNISYKLHGLKRKSLRSILKREIGRSKAGEFSHLDDVPCRVNLLGCSYRGILQDGRRVIITINDKREVKAFNQNVDHIQWIFDWVFPQIDKFRSLIWQGIYDEFLFRSQYLSDLTQAGSRIEILQDQFKDNSKIVIPEVFWEYTTPSVLVHSCKNWPDAKSVSSDDGEKSVSKKYAVRYIVESFASQYCVGGHFLARPRLSDFQIGDKNKILINNFLCLGFLEPKTRQIFARLLTSILRNDAEKASKTLLEAHYEIYDLENYHRAGLVLDNIEGKNISEKLWLVLDRAWRGNIIIPLGISQAAESILYLEHSMRKFGIEDDFEEILLNAIRKI